MNVAFLVGKFPALSETFILDQITGLIDLGVSVNIFAFSRREDGIVQPEVEQYALMEKTFHVQMPEARMRRVLSALRVLGSLPARRLPLALSGLNALRYGRDAASLHLLHMLHPFMNGKDYDLMHCHFGNIGKYGRRLKQLGVANKLLVTFHGYDVSRLVHHPENRDTYLQVFNAANLLLPVSEYWRQRLIDLGADPACTVVHRMGIDLESFTFHPRALEEGEPVRLFTTGRLVEKKGIEYGLRAVAEVIRRHPGWKIQYEIVGTGPLEERLNTLIDELDLRGYAHLLGPLTRSEIQHKMRTAHLCLLPSVTAEDGDQEGIPVSLMEAMATGLPVLSTCHTGIPELVEDGVTGVLSEERDVEGLADRLEYLIQHPELWSEMGRKGRAFVEENHNNRLLIPELKGIYERVVG